MLIGLHSVLLVGWDFITLENENKTDTGVDSLVPYWIVKNSWGSDWGELGGYFRIKFGESFIADQSFDGTFSCTPKNIPIY